MPAGGTGEQSRAGQAATLTSQHAVDNCGFFFFRKSGRGSASTTVHGHIQRDRSRYVEGRKAELVTPGPTEHATGGCVRGIRHTHSHVTPHPHVASPRLSSGIVIAITIPPPYPLSHEQWVWASPFHINNILGQVSQRRFVGTRVLNYLYYVPRQSDMV